MQITEKTGPLVAVTNVTDDHDLMIINRSGVTIRMHIADLRVLGRNTQGVKLINLRGKDSIASITKVDAEPEEETTENPENAIETEAVNIENNSGVGESDGTNPTEGETSQE